ncbi:MAG: hypothetical protein JNK05_36245 [Myxococcales bacterium]|nr:hypothetical protein [Myxococcales bacterium]
MKSRRTTVVWIAIVLGGCASSSLPQESRKFDGAVDNPTDSASIDAPPAQGDSAAAPDVSDDGLYRHCIAPDNARVRPFMNYQSADGSGCTCVPPLNMGCNHRAPDRRCRMPGGETVALGERWTSPDRCITCDCFAHSDDTVGFRCETAERCNAFTRPGCFRNDGQFVPGGSPSPTQRCSWCSCDPGGFCQREYGPSCPP